MSCISEETIRTSFLELNCCTVLSEAISAVHLLVDFIVRKV